MNNINNNRCNSINNNSCFNNNNNSNIGCNSYLIQLYNCVFKNKYLKKLIFYHLNIFNILSIGIDFGDIEQWEAFKYKEYLYSVIFRFRYSLDKLPENIKYIEIQLPTITNYNHNNINNNNKNNNIVSLPNHPVYISASLENSQFKSPIIQSIISSPKAKLSTFNVYLTKSENQLPPIPASVTNLLIKGTNGTNLSKKCIPENLKRLAINNVRLYENGCISNESLRNISIIESPSLLINQLSLEGVVKLHFICILSSIDSNIQFPNSLQELNIRCNMFSAKLPPRLKSFELFVTFFRDEIEFPPSLDHLSIQYCQNRLNRNIFHDHQLMPSNLKSLEFQISSITDDNNISILSEKLERLVIRSLFNQIIQVYQLPPSLVYLDLGSFNRIIGVNVLPAGLETLLVGDDYSQVISPLAIPKQLKLLKINNSRYQHPIKLTPSTHPNTVISCESIELYYQETSSEYDQIRVLRLPDSFYLPLSILRLQNKSNLEYLHLGNDFNFPIELSDLPIQNNIKTLICSEIFNQTINLEHFQNLETLIIQNELTSLKIITTIDQHGYYNNYKLKNIIVPIKLIKSTQFLAQLDLNFYQFLKLNNKYNMGRINSINK